MHKTIEVWFRSVTLVVSKMDTLMMCDLLALKDGEISEEMFSEKLILHKYKFNEKLNTIVKNQLPDKKLPKIGNG